MPQYLVEGQISAVAMIETDAAVSDFFTPFQSVVQEDLEQYDYLWFIPKVEEIPFCQRMEEEAKE